ncbi:hypothetical protein C0W92_20660 [Photobacterium angustum]|uniref:Uncharacterized protein n=1 Tax=Photobacterium angustum TaxID=661 RepID=A0A855S7Z5_PHOAN|nr:hypothetical protein UB36_18130 [Photobacterium damselae subsp. damselae]KJG28528.1 hypothetical protein UA69_16375 [Photobacterium angustum]KJG36864.1 hypothetical protein UA35_18530 [Photobacterium angustum]KJG43748.1 hypothetical protein UA31_18135 [Photobacterium angustum]KJG46290.1 hypothetical protein UA30_18050 [Photobacterium angustum]
MTQEAYWIVRKTLTDKILQRHDVDAINGTLRITCSQGWWHYYQDDSKRNGTPTQDELNCYGQDTEEQNSSG